MLFIILAAENIVKVENYFTYFDYDVLIDNYFISSSRVIAWPKFNSVTAMD